MSAPAARSETIAFPPQPEKRFLLLDGLRGVAAFAVIVDHVPSGLLGDLIPGRALSVDFFFALSGFVLAHAYGGQLQGGWSPWAFMRARLIRLYPFYLVGALIGIPYAALQMIKGWTEPVSPPEFVGLAALALVFLPQPPTSPGNIFPFNGPAWSLFFELLVNAVYAMTARFLTLRILAFVLPVGAALLCFGIFNHADVRGPGWRWSHFDAGFARAMYGFFAGVGIYKLREHIRLPSLPWWAAVLAFVLIISAPTAPAWTPVYDAIAGIVLMPLLVALASGATVSGVVAKCCGIFGLLSYGVYVLHVPLYGVLQAALLGVHVTIEHSAFAPVIVAVMAASAAAIGNHFYDTPFRRWLSRAIPGASMREKNPAIKRKRG
ncbi:MAG: acyltransferase [Hyphomonadaceae bacterium]